VSTTRRNCTLAADAVYRVGGNFQKETDTLYRFAGVRKMKSYEANKQNISLNPEQYPHQIRPTSSEFKYETTKRPTSGQTSPDTGVKPIPATLPHYHIASLLQYVYGLRISEVLSIRNGDVSEDGFVLIKGKKGSNDRVVYEPLLLHLTNPNPIFDKTLLFPFSYSQYRRVCLKYGIYIKPTGKRKKMIITHLFRHNRIKKIYKLTELSLPETKRFTGQKNNISAMHYINSLKEK
jgi:integrase